MPRTKTQLPWARTPRRERRQSGIFQIGPGRAPPAPAQSQSPDTPSSCWAASSPGLSHGSMASLSVTDSNILGEEFKMKQKKCSLGHQHTPSSKAHRLLTSCSLWLNTSCRTSITLWRMFSISVTLCRKKRETFVFVQGNHFFFYQASDNSWKQLVQRPRVSWRTRH